MIDPLRRTVPTRVRGLPSHRHIVSRWGEYRRTVSRGGVLVEELTVHPPGTGLRDRMLSRLLGVSPIAGAAGGMLIGLAAVGETPWLLLFALAGGAALLAVIHRATRRVRAGTRRVVRAVDLLTDGDVDEDTRLVLVSCLDRLRALDARSGELGPIVYELGWARAYQSLPSPRR